jgi:hypothetical protein
MLSNTVAARKVHSQRWSAFCSTFDFFCGVLDRLGLLVDGLGSGVLDALRRLNGAKTKVRIVRCCCEKTIKMPLHLAAVFFFKAFSAKQKKKKKNLFTIDAAK